VSLNEADTRYHLIDPVLRDKGYVSRERITLETVLTPPPVEPTGARGRRRRGPGRTDYLLCVQVGDMPRAMPVAVLDQQVKAITYCHDTYRVTTADGKTRAFWERNLRLKTDSGKDGPQSGTPAVVPAGMMGDRADVIFAAPEEISKMIEPRC
jgi:hypothetical protein